MAGGTERCGFTPALRDSATSDVPAAVLFQQVGRDASPLRRSTATLLQAPPEGASARKLIPAGLSLALFALLLTTLHARGRARLRCVWRYLHRRSDLLALASRFRAANDYGSSRCGDLARRHGRDHTWGSA